MSTNGTSPNGAARRSGSESVRGVRVLSDDAKVPSEDELGFPVNASALWDVFGSEDPSSWAASTNNDISFDDLHNMTKTDGHARALLNVLSLPLRAAKRAIDPDGDGEEEAEFCENMLSLPPYKGGMTTPFSYVMSCHALAFRDGFALFEKVAQVNDDGQLTLRKLSPRPTRTLTIKYDDHGGLAGVRQRVWWDQKSRDIFIPPEKCLLFTVGKEESPLVGESLFLPAYYHYDKKHRLYYLAHIAAQSVAAGIRVGEVPATKAASIDAFRRALQNLALSGSLTHLPGFKVDVHDVKSDLSGILSWAEHHDVAMSKSILAHFLDVGTEGKGGLGTATTTSELGDLFEVALTAYLSDIAAGFNAYVFPAFIDHNFGSGKSPTMRFEPFSDETNVVLFEAFKTIYSPNFHPDTELLLNIQREVSDALGIGGIDWDTKIEQAKEEEELNKEVETLLKGSQPSSFPVPGSQGSLPNPASQEPGEGGQASPPALLPSSTGSGVTLDEARKAAQAALALAEKAEAASVFLDSVGQRGEVGSDVMLTDPTVEDIYTVHTVSGNVLVLRAADGSVRASQPAEVLIV